MKTAFLCIAAIAAISPLRAQNLSCNALPVDTPAIRDTGVHEKVGDVKILCTGGTPIPVNKPTFHLLLFISPVVSITSRTLDTIGTTEALLLIDEPDANSLVVCTPLNRDTCNVVPGKRVSPSQLRFDFIPFSPSGIGPARVLRITNVYADASQMNNVFGSATAVNLITLPTTVGIPIEQSFQVPVGNPNPFVAVAQSPLSFVQLNALGQSAPPPTLPASAGNNIALAQSPASSLAPQGASFAVKISENFSSVLRSRTAGLPPDDNTQGPVTAQSNLQMPMESETGYFAPTLPATGGLNSAGLASHGTRILVKFSPLAAGVKLFAPVRLTLTQNGTSTTTGKLRMVNAWSTGSSGSLFTPTAATSTVGGGIAPLAGCPSACQAIYEVIDTTTYLTENALMPVYVAFAPTASTIDATVNVALGPISNPGLDAIAPRFVGFTRPSIAAFEIH